MNQKPTAVGAQADTKGPPIPKRANAIHKVVRSLAKERVTPLIKTREAPIVIE